jgi:glycerol uptake facilitator protein
VNDILGEFLGTMMLVLLGDGVVAGVLLARSKAQNAGWIAITAGWAFAVMGGVYTARAVGAPGFINPVGPLAGVLTGSLAPEKAIGYVVAEFCGAFVGAIFCLAALLAALGGDTRHHGKARGLLHCACNPLACCKRP